MQWSCVLSSGCESRSWVGEPTPHRVENACSSEALFCFLWLLSAFHLCLEQSWRMWIQIFSVTVELCLCAQSGLQILSHSLEGRAVNGFTHTTCFFLLYFIILRLLFFRCVAILVLWRMMDEAGKSLWKHLWFSAMHLGVSCTWLMYDLSDIPATSWDKAAALSKMPAAVI